MWRKSIEFMKKAIPLGFHVEVFSIVTKENMEDIDTFEKRLNETLGMAIPVTYHPRKPLKYLQSHPVSNHVGEVKHFSFIEPADRVTLGTAKNIFPPLKLGCYQISLMSDGMVYGCCEGMTPLGKMTEAIPALLDIFASRIQAGGNCVEPDFKCGLEAECL